MDGHLQPRVEPVEKDKKVQTVRAHHRMLLPQRAHREQGDSHAREPAVAEASMAGRPREAAMLQPTGKAKG